MSDAAVAAFGLLDLRVGRITRAEPNTGARKPSYRLWVDFGAAGERTETNFEIKYLREGRKIYRLAFQRVGS